MRQGKGRNTGQVAYIVTWKNMCEPSLQVEVSVNSRGGRQFKGGKGCGWEPRSGNRPMVTEYVCSMGNNPYCVSI